MYITFFRYKGHTLAINHNWEDDPQSQLAVMKCRECSQYPHNKELMDAVMRILSGKEDGEYRFSRQGEWKRYPLDNSFFLHGELALVNS